MEQYKYALYLLVCFQMTECKPPDCDNTGLGNAAEWSKTSKLGHLYQLGQRNFKRLRNQITNARAAEANRAFSHYRW